MNKRSLLLILFLLIGNTVLITPTAQALKVSTVHYRWPVLQIIAGIACLPFLAAPIENENIQLVLGTGNLFFNSYEGNRKQTSINLLPIVAGVILIGQGIKNLIK